MDLTLQLFFERQWNDVALLTLKAPNLGYEGATTFSYEMQYFVDVGSIPFAEGKAVRDARALSVAIPVDLEDRNRTTWPPFLLDLLPQGLQRERIAAHLKLDPDARSSDVKLLLHGAGSPVGNMRIKEARTQELLRVAAMPRNGLSMEDILDRTDRFLSVSDTSVLLASGSSGLQGNWPKIAMTRAADGNWYPDSTVEDADAHEHIIVKLTRSNEALDETILRSEAAYSAIAAEFGLRVHEKSQYGAGVLVVPRFDRLAKNGELRRYGQESLVSALGVSEFNHIDSHENYLEMLRGVSSDPLADVIEYVLRDVLNLAMGNPDNHGRNTALRKTADGVIRLSPLFDFAPMKLSRAVIVRSTKWDCMKVEGRDYNPDWKIVCEAAAGDDLPADEIVNALSRKESFIRSLPDIGRRYGLSDDVIGKAFAAHGDIADAITAMKRVP
jgi:serine/threonine-protein kinase HipA